MPKKNTGDETMGRIETKLDLFKEHLDEHVKTMTIKIEKVDARVEKVDERQDTTNVILGKQQVILDDHVRRSNNLEEKMETDKKEIEEKLETQKKSLEATIEPIKTHVSQMKLILKIGAAILSAGAGGFGLKELFSIFSN